MIVGIIPAREGSKRLPGKNLMTFAGKPLIQHIIEASILSKYLDKIIVTSDSKNVIKIAKKFSGVNVIKRPSELCTDISPAIDYVKHLINILENQAETLSIGVILQPTSPLTLTSDIDATIELLLDSGADTAVSMVKLGHMVNPLKLKLLEGNRVKPYLEDENSRMAAHDIPKVYVRNCAVYASKRSVYDSGSIIGKDCRAYVMPRERSVDINDFFDFQFAEFLFNRNSA